MYASSLRRKQSWRVLVESAKLGRQGSMIVIGEENLLGDLI
jgi:hypothetical protein